MFPPERRNSQCAGISACAVAYAVAFDRMQMTQNQINAIVIAGDEFYERCRALLTEDHAHLIADEELQPDLTLFGRSLALTYSAVSMGRFASPEEESSDANIRELECNLHMVLDENDVNCGYFFTGHIKTVSFWKEGMHFLLFDSHRVDEMRNADLHNGVARLFKAESVYDLARLLLWGHPKDLTYYQIYKVSVTELLNYSVITPHAAIEPDRSHQHLRASQNETISLDGIGFTEGSGDSPKLQWPGKTSSVNIDEGKTIKSRGRPAKRKRGRPKTSLLTRVEQIHTAKKKYNEAQRKKHCVDVAKYIKTHPDVNRRAVEKYTKTHPDVNRRAVDKYTKTHPDVHRRAVDKYTDTHPEVNRGAVGKYQFTHAVSRSASRRITRAVPPELRTFTCIGDKSGKELDSVQIHQLKVPSLLNDKTFKCQYCAAPLFLEEKERSQWCCGAGVRHKQVLPPLTATFYKNETFLKNARAYNSLFSFSALAVTHGIVTLYDDRSFYKVQGRVYHKVCDLDYKGQVRNNLTLYISDSVERLRLANQEELDPTITVEIASYLERVNPLIGQLRNLSLHASDNAHLVFQKTTRRSHGTVEGDNPVVDEIAGVIKLDAECEPQYVSPFDPAYECLQYPLLFPNASAGWSVDLRDNEGKKLSLTKFVRHQVMSDSRFTAMRRLSQEYLVDMWCRIEEQRLQFFKHNQGSLRIGTREDVSKVARNQVESDIASDETVQGEGGAVAGKIYLPSTFTHGPRYMRVKYHDAMAIVVRKGRPSFFLTVTCNPRWIEIESSLVPGEHAIDRPDLCARVFNLKLTALLRLIRSGKLFGPITYILHVVEFQKRGLPHAHLAIRREDGGPEQPDDIYRFVRATIPSQTEAGGRLRELVLKHQLHGPCGVGNPNCPCMDKEKNKCTKMFPKVQLQNTYVDDRGYVQYRRPCEEGNITVSRRKGTVNDLWVVPYNSAVLLLFESHCNLEACSTVAIIKYLFKYINKGPDHARVGILDDVQVHLDEVEHYATHRYISASEAAWRLFEFPVSGREPAVEALSVHLPGRDMVVHRRGQEARALTTHMSKLDMYLNRPKVPQFCNLTFVDFYEMYTIGKGRKRTVPAIEHCCGQLISQRVRGECVVRIQWVSPALGEVFYLRMLLSQFAAFSFEELRTVNNVVYPTFQEAAKAHGLLDDDNEYRDALSEASTFKTGRGLRQLFFCLIVCGAPAGLLWSDFKDILSEDHLERNRDNPEMAYNLTLCEIDHMLRNHGKTLADVGLPTVTDVSTEAGREVLRWSRERCINYTNEWLPKLSVEQTCAYKKILQLVSTPPQRNDSRVVFIDGPSGTGKTVLLNVVTSALRQNGNIVLCTATTGIAALNYEGGTTAHSMFKIPFEMSNNVDVCNVSSNSERAELIRQAVVIIWDEAPMAHNKNIESVNRLLKDLQRSSFEFGGKVVVFAGDFRQIPPIIRNAGVGDIVKASLKSTTFWKSVHRYKLCAPQRSRDDQEYSDFILDVGEGRIGCITVGTSKVIGLSGVQSCNDLDELIEFVYPEDVLTNSVECCTRAILSGTNNNIKQINNLILARLPGEVVHLYSADSLIVEESTSINRYGHTEMLNMLSASGVPDHDIALKIGSVVILIRNLSFEDKLVNGTKLIVVNINRLLIEARLPGSLETVFIPRIAFKFDAGNCGFEVLRRQFPLKLAYALTFNKSQGQTLNKVGVDLRADVFAHGQLYVALGRVRSSGTIRVLVPQQHVEAASGVPHTVNIVHPELL